MKTWEIKQETTKLIQNNDTPERYLKKFLSNVQVVKQKDCGIWLNDRTIMAELKISKGATITWELADTKDTEKSTEVATKRMQAMAFFQQSGRRYDGPRQETEKNVKRTG